MKDYDIEIEEVLRRIVSVKADNIDEARVLKTMAYTFLLVASYAQR